MGKIRAAVIGYGNIGRYAAEAVLAAPDMELAGIVRREGEKNKPPALDSVQFIDEETDISVLGGTDVAILCKPTRQIKIYAEKYLTQGINTVDSFDTHPEILGLREYLEPIAKAHNAAAIISAGFDPGIDSVVRVLMEAGAPSGITYTDFGPGMSMGHTTVVKAIPGVADALSLTIPTGAGVHRRMVYVQLKYGADIETVSRTVKADPYFVNDDTHVIAVPDISALADAGHGVHISRKGRSGVTDNQLLSFDMRINNPAFTSQMLVSCARAVVKQKPGVYTMPEIPPIDLLCGTRESIISRMV